MTATRRYGDGCAIATALDFVGERWALLIVRELLLGPKRFKDLQEGLPGAGPKILAQRLRELQAGGVLQRRTLPPPAGSQVYELTDWGAQLDGIIFALGHWGARAPEPTGDHVGADSAMLRLRSYFNPQPHQQWTATYDVRLGRDRYTLRIDNGHLADLRRGEPLEPPDAVIDSDPGTFARVLGDDNALAEAITKKRLVISANNAAGRRLFDAVRVCLP